MRDGRRPAVPRAAVRAVVAAIAAMAAKWMAHELGIEVLSLNPLFSGLLSATVFLVGFLVAGVLADYKEAEKLPGEVAVSLEAFADEFDIAYRTSRDPAARDALVTVLQIARSVEGWLRLGGPNGLVLDGIAALNGHFIALQPLVLPNYLVRLKQEQQALRRTVTRIHTIRMTSFVGAVYNVARLMAGALLVGLLVANIERVYEAMFFIGVIAFLVVYILDLISDLDNPFEFGPAADSQGEVSLQPVGDVISRLERLLAESASSPDAPAPQMQGGTTGR